VVNRRNIIIVLTVVLLIVITGCRNGAQPVADLTPLNGKSVWNIPVNLRQEGDGNSAREVAGPSLANNTDLELAAGGSGSMEYSTEIAAGAQVIANCNLQFLSTQGSGRVRLSAIATDGRILGSIGWVVTGAVPKEKNAKWSDLHFKDNYSGKWLNLGGNVAELLKKDLPGVTAEAAKYRLSVEVGQGQHVLIASCGLRNIPILGLKLTPEAETITAKLGDIIAVNVEVENTGNQLITGAMLKLNEPAGYGLVVQDNCTQMLDIMPGEKRRLSWQVKAQRPDTVNLGKPWPITFTSGDTSISGTVMVHVTDTRPGEVFYVMTEDLEPIDAAGYPTTWGNADGWLEPDELRVQMVEKVRAADAVAERYGAKWTHYIAWPVVKAAEWAAERSSTGKWESVVAAIKESVRQEAGRGHEYGVHMHSDYDPYLPNNVLSYNSLVDGIWANHLRHGWAQIIADEGTSFDDYASRTGTIYRYKRIVDELSSDSAQGELLTARAGSFDFGASEVDQAKSTQAYQRAGLWGGSDADGNIGGTTAGDFGKEIYFAGPANINAASADINSTGIVEIRPTPRQFIQYDSQNAVVMNKKVDEGVAFFAPDGKIKPGVHAIVGFTHIMFMMGEGGWQSTQGGQFTALDDHLHYLRDRYVSTGMLKFGTASDLVRAYLDYYSPKPVAVYGARLSDGWGVAEYSISVLGRDIPIDASHPHTISVKYPLYLRDSAYRISILKDGKPIYTTSGLPTPFNDIVFVVDDANAKYSMKVYYNEYVHKIFDIFHVMAGKLLKH